MEPSQFNRNDMISPRMSVYIVHTPCHISCQYTICVQKGRASVSSENQYISCKCWQKLRLKISLCPPIKEPKNPAFHVGSDSTHVMASAWHGGKGVVKQNFVCLGVPWAMHSHLRCSSIFYRSPAYVFLQVSGGISSKNPSSKFPSDFGTTSTSDKGISDTPGNLERSKDYAGNQGLQMLQLQPRSAKHTTAFPLLLGLRVKFKVGRKIRGRRTLEYRHLHRFIQSALKLVQFQSFKL